MPDLLADIKNGHNEVYEKRHQRIEEKKAVLLVQEQAKQEAEQSDKQQSEVGMQTEEQPQEEDIAGLTIISNQRIEGGVICPLFVPNL